LTSAQLERKEQRPSNALIHEVGEQWIVENHQSWQGKYSKKVNWAFSHVQDSGFNDQFVLQY